MLWELLRFFFWNPAVKLLAIFILFFLHFNAYMALWFLYCELSGHFLDNICTLIRIEEALKARAEVIAIRNDLFNEEV